MSLSDDEEALFDDIYGDDDKPKDEIKKKEEEAKAKETEEETKEDNENEESKDDTKEDSKDATPSNDTEGSTSQSTVPPPPPSAPETTAPSTSGVNANESKTESNISIHPESSNSTPNQQKVDLSRDAAKMFIGGLDWDTSEERLKEYFTKFGEVVDHTIMRESSTGRSRGFGFLTFADPRSVDEVVKTEHVLDGKVIDPKRAIPRDEQDKTGKIFVGGIAPEVRPKEFEQFFSKFGTIIDAQLMLDKDTGRSRGFGFVTFDAPDAVDRVCQGRYLDFNGRQIEVKRAEPRGPQQQQNHIQQQQQRYLQQQGFGGSGYQQQGSGYSAGGASGAAGAGAGANPYGGAIPGAQPGMPAGGAAYGGVTPEVMTQYWQQMQAYWLQFQQQAQQSGSNVSPQDVQALAAQLQQGQVPGGQASLPGSVPPPPPSQDSNSNYGQGQQGSYNNDGGYGNHRRRGGPPNAPRGPRGRGRGRGGYNRNNGGGYHPYQRS